MTAQLPEIHLGGARARAGGGGGGGGGGGMCGGAQRAGFKKWSATPEMALSTVVRNQFRHGTAGERASGRAASGGGGGGGAHLERFGGSSRRQRRRRACVGGQPACRSGVAAGAEPRPVSPARQCRGSSACGGLPSGFKFLLLHHHRGGVVVAAVVVVAPVVVGWRRRRRRRRGGGARISGHRFVHWWQPQQHGPRCLLIGSSSSPRARAAPRRAPPAPAPAPAPVPPAPRRSALLSLIMMPANPSAFAELAS